MSYLPGDISLVEIDGGKDAIRRFQKRQSLDGKTASTAFASGRTRRSHAHASAAGRRCAGSSAHIIHVRHFRWRLDEAVDADGDFGKHIEQMGFRIEGSARPVGPTLISRRDNGGDGAILLADYRGREERTDFVLRNQLYGFFVEFRCEVDQVVELDALVAVGGRFSGNRLGREYHSPGTSPCGTGVSTMGQMGLPVWRSNT